MTGIFTVILFILYKICFFWFFA